VPSEKLGVYEVSLERRFGEVEVWEGDGALFVHNILDTSK
jgi:hypothetical protein